MRFSEQIISADKYPSIFSHQGEAIVYVETRVEVWENEKCCGNTSRRRVFPQLFRVLPNFHECFYNSIETRRTCFLFLLGNTETGKRETTCEFSLLAPSLRQQLVPVLSLVPRVLSPCFYRV